MSDCQLANSSKLQTPSTFVSRIKAPSVSAVSVVKKGGITPSQQQTPSTNQSSGKTQTSSSEIKPALKIVEEETKQGKIGCGVTSARIQPLSQALMSSENGICNEGAGIQRVSNLASKHQQLLGGKGLIGSSQPQQDQSSQRQSLLSSKLPQPKIGGTGIITTKTLKEQSSTISSSSSKTKKSKVRQTNSIDPDLQGTSNLQKVKNVTDLKTSQRSSRNNAGSQLLQSAASSNSSKPSFSRIGKGCSSVIQPKSTLETPSNVMMAASEINQTEQQLKCDSPFEMAQEVKIDKHKSDRILSTLDQITHENQSQIQRRLQQVVVVAAQNSSQTRNSSNSSLQKQTGSTATPMRQSHQKASAMSKSFATNNIGPKIDEFGTSPGRKINLRGNIASTFENAKLEETIKSLEINLASLPESFTRVSRIRDLSNKKDRFAIGRPSNLPQKVMGSKLDELLESLSTMKPKVEEDREEESNLSLRAFLPAQMAPLKPVFTETRSPAHSPNIQFTVLEGDSEQPFNNDDDDDDMIFDEADDDLLRNDETTEIPEFEEQWERQDTDLTEEEKFEDHPQSIIAQSQALVTHLQLSPKLKISEVLADSFEPIVSIRQQPPQVKERVSLTALYKQQNKLSMAHKSKKQIDENHMGKSRPEQKPPLKSERSSLVPPSTQTMVVTSSGQNFYNTTQGASTASSFNQTSNPPPKYGLNPCQRQGPALQTRKAFDHKRRKQFARDEQHPNEFDKRLECEHCYRRFQEESLLKHAPVCEKVFIKKRKVFNGLTQRALDEEHLKMIEAAQQKFSYYNENQKLNTKWRLRSQQFRTDIESARNPQQQEEQRAQDDRIQCRYCDKRFCATTAERHIPLCEKKAKDLKRKTAAAASTITRTSNLGSKRSTN